jgi:glucokinase-like ROK family protein
VSKVIRKNQIRSVRILRTLLDRGQLSLTDLARSTGMSITMVSSVISDLKRDHFVRTVEDKESSRAGRPPIVARLNGEAGYVLGIDVGRLNTNLVLLNLEQTIVAEAHQKTMKLSNDPAFIDELAQEIGVILRRARVSPKRLLGIGISIPGFVRGREGISETYLHFGEKTLREILEERFGKKVHIEHDAKAMALGERWFGAARNVANALCLNIGWGLGMGVLLDGKLFYGRDGYAGEFGHIQAVPNGLLCTCGKRGCLETVASGRAIARIARDRVGAGASSMLRESVGGNLDLIDAELVVKAAVAGDQFSIEILEEAGRFLGEGVAKLINLFNPELIIFGGRVSGAGHFILDPIRSTALKQSLVQLSKGVEFTISTIGTKAGALGVAMLAARDLFEVDHLNPSAFV